MSFDTIVDVCQGVFSYLNTQTGNIYISFSSGIIYKLAY